MDVQRIYGNGAFAAGCMAVITATKFIICALKTSAHEGIAISALQAFSFDGSHKKLGGRITHECGHLVIPGIALCLISVFLMYKAHNR